MEQDSQRKALRVTRETTFPVSTRPEFQKFSYDASLATAAVYATGAHIAHP